ncbi:zinc finger protein 106 [Gouania willdenowi]|uniref:Zinc finger protein 106-like n=1 Tax=Gouania willdenowi TaxID=441366 RepID=A0A8C5GKA0_GOUWI|nr:zinc finger protein 106-like [Gouania willdenowi]XP_028293029.1 zinc finger protein 106-like [Gouania willdenowi]XP_028293030.1 zinc finger protein 106-like [Gouania willdenowi]
MARDRKCILCETVHASKQEMDEHMRSMLHHRELENLKGRDCGHECRVCKVKMVSLTDYASHISSPSHKQNVEASDKKQAGSDHDEIYFDRELVDLIERRKEKIRKEKEAAAAKLAKEEEDRKRKQAFEQKLREAKARYRQDSSKQPPPFHGSGQRNSWNNGNWSNNRTGDQMRPFYHSNQGRSATWHAQEPPNLERWGYGEFCGRNFNNNDSQGNNFRSLGSNGNRPNRLPWLSSGGSSNGLYGQNNISQYAQRGRPNNFMGSPSMYPSMPDIFGQFFQKFQNSDSHQQRQQQAESIESKSDHSSSKSTKTNGSNSKLDKACRWSPYPATKGPESDTKTNASEKIPSTSKSWKQNKTQETCGFTQQLQSTKKSGQLTSSRQSADDCGKHHKHDTSTTEDGRSCGFQRDGQDIASSLSQKTRKLMQADQKTSSLDKTQKVSSLVEKQSKPSGRESKVKAAPVGAHKSRQESLKKPRQADPDRKDSLDGSEDSVKKQKQDQALAHVELNKENSFRQNAAKPQHTDPERPEKLFLSPSDNSQFLQSLQVSTSTIESSKPAALERVNKEELAKKASPDVAMQISEAGQSDASKISEAQAASNTATQPKLDLPLIVMKLGSKGKAVAHEPNLNIARRVRNLSESRRSDSEKDPGLKPTVRQLINSSSSRRNVNWDQVYQEVRKKQDQGKGMPRFGIEMVSCENQSQADEDIPLLEGFHWDSMIDVSAQGSSRKRSLSESSLAPASTHSLFTSEKKALNSEEQGPKVSQFTVQVKLEENPDQELEQISAQSESKTTMESNKSIKALQQIDLVLGDSSSGTEQCNVLGTGKRRRPVREVHSIDSQCIEHNSKRRKLKSKKERLQIDQLLKVSLREEELSRSLQGVDTNLIQARAALEAAYVEVQRLMLVKQQMTEEMSTLRNKRIELLKGMKETVEEAPVINIKEERMDFDETEAHIPSAVTLSSPTILSPARVSECTSPPTSSLSFKDVNIKQEPLSPVHVSTEQEPTDFTSHCTHSSTAATAPDTEPNVQPSPENKPQHHQTDFKVPPFTKEEEQEPTEETEALLQTTSAGPQTSRKLLSTSRRSSEISESADFHCFQPPSAAELKSGKRVRKLKKRKVLNKAQSGELPQSSDTEMDDETARPSRLRARRRASEGSQVSTSSLQTEEGETNAESSVKDATLRKVEVRLERIDRSFQKQSKLPVRASDDPSEENMEITSISQEKPSAPHSSASTMEEQHSLACNEVSSTSDIDLCKSSESDMPFPTRIPKNSSDVSSDHGEDEIPSEGSFEGHQEAVNAMQIHNRLLYTCSGDRTVKAFDLVTRRCVGVFEGHASKVSCLFVSAAPSLQQRLYSGSSDQTIRCYNLKTQELEEQFSVADRVLCLHSRWRTLYAGLGNGTVMTFNLKTNKAMDVFECHGPRAVSCLASSQEGARRILLVGSYDNTISVRDATSGLLLRILEGHSKTVLCMKVMNDLVFSGSSDQCVHVHNIHSGKLTQVYKGHSHGVTVVAVLGNVMVTACMDKLVRVYDQQSGEQLQVYGGHRDMVMCMAVNRNMIYTGCYDGSVQAVKLNLMQSHRCWWHGCSLVFARTQHLQQHLASDHIDANAKTLKCRWKSCEELLISRSSTKQVQQHMQKHVEEEETPTEP